MNNDRKIIEAKNNNIITIEPKDLKINEFNNSKKFSDFDYNKKNAYKKILSQFIKFIINSTNLSLKYIKFLFKILYKISLKSLSVLMNILKSLIDNCLKYIKNKSKSKDGRKTLALLCLGILLFVNVSYSFAQSKELNKEIDVYKDIILKKNEEISKQKDVISKTETLINQVEILNKKETKDVKPTLGITDRAVELFNLQKPSPENFDKKYLQSYKHDILDEKIKKEALNWVESTYYKEVNSNIGKLGEKIIFDLTDITKTSNLTEENFESLIKDTELKGIGKSLVESEKKYNVNGIILLSIAGLESGWGTSEKSKEMNNITGYRVEDKNGDNTAKKFKNKSECILETAKRLNELYLTEKDNKFTLNVKEGMFFNGKRLVDVNVKYCSQIDWFEKISNISHREVDKLKSITNI